MSGQQQDGEGGEEGEAERVLEEHVGEDVDVVGEEEVGEEHVAGVAGDVEQGQEGKEAGGGGMGRGGGVFSLS